MAKNYPPQDPLKTAMGRKCPRCGEGALFAGFLKVRPECPRCGLDYSKADTGDGPAVFMIFIVGFLAMALAMILQLIIHMPIWLVLLLSVILSVALIGVLTPMMKAWLVAQQYNHHAAEGRMREQDRPDQ